MGSNTAAGSRKQSKQTSGLSVRDSRDNSQHHSTATYGQKSKHTQPSSPSRQALNADALRQAEIKAQAHLRKRRLHHVSVTLAGSPELPAKKGNLMYFISDADIKDVIEIVVDALRQTYIAPDHPKSSKSYEKIMRGYGSITAGFEYGRNSITPRPSAVADPATTISIPKTVFSSTNWGNRQLSATDLKYNVSKKTTVVSRGSVSEIVWGKTNASQPARIPETLASGELRDDAVDHNRMKSWSSYKAGPYPRMMETEGTAAFYRPGALEPFSTDLAFKQRMSRSTDEDSNITSFPELRPRQCTNDWLKPPVEIEQLIRAPSSDLYHRGIDAHSGIVPNSPGGA
ncbi:hypothetical protein QQS21_010631 [Conoideocrella luteorostrata]|uniref:Uncharacterized protein n=1 Tax=Conoideocrella luteorostrata TaxID=1105319 RepID=A0AAJ0FP62_9HYPO|nr:hypothetical protein QQS21_010631 [Conoideocrella luteorostrata]